MGRIGRSTYLGCWGVYNGLRLSQAWRCLKLEETFALRDKQCGARLLEDIWQAREEQSSFFTSNGDFTVALMLVLGGVEPAWSDS